MGFVCVGGARLWNRPRGSLCDKGLVFRAVRLERCARGDGFEASGTDGERCIRCGEQFLPSENHREAVRATRVDTQNDENLWAEFRFLHFSPSL